MMCAFGQPVWALVFSDDCICVSVGCLKPDDHVVLVSVRCLEPVELSLAGDRDVLFVCRF